MRSSDPLPGVGRRDAGRGHYDGGVRRAVGQVAGSGPVSLTHCTPVTRKAPAVFWLGQKLRDAPVRVEVSVVSGLSLSPSGASYAPPPRSAGQSWLVVLLAAPSAFAP